MSETILLVEDEEKLARMVELELRYEGYEVEKAFDGRTGLERALSGGFDLVLLDIMLPQLSGMEVLRRLRRERSTPVIMLTARDSVIDKVSGLDSGADDYITKPFRPRELIARIRAALRKQERTGQAFEVCDLCVDTASGVVTKYGREIFLSALEYRLLLIFMNNPKNIITRSRLLDELWDAAGEFVSDNTLTVYIKRLREKIENDPANPQIILTVRGTGYRLGGNDAS